MPSPPRKKSVDNRQELCYNKYIKRKGNDDYD